MAAPNVTALGRLVAALAAWERTVAGKDGLVVVGEWLFLLSQDQQLACLGKANGHVRWVSALPRFRRPYPL